MIRDTFYADSILAWVESQGGLEAVKKRLMPKGMEWPKFEDGETVELGDKFRNPHDGVSVLSTVTIKDCCGSLGGDLYWRLGKGKNAVILKSGERVKRPAPKVLDADGMEIRVGDVVFVIETGKAHHVTAVDPIGMRFKSMEQMGDDATWLDPPCFTHRAPVLAADGKPLKVGETVYDINDSHGHPGTVVSTELDGLGHVKVACEKPTPASVSIHPSRLTHEAPDSWGSVWMDVSNGLETPLGMKRRCKALEERERRS